MGTVLDWPNSLSGEELNKRKSQRRSSDPGREAQSGGAQSGAAVKDSKRGPTIGLHWEAHLRMRVGVLHCSGMGGGAKEEVQTAERTKFYCEWGKIETVAGGGDQERGSTSGLLSELPGHSWT